MKKPNVDTTSQHINEVVNFLETRSQFSYSFTEENLEITQIEDSKKMVIDFRDVDKVLDRQDVDGSQFIQVNFSRGSKILITKALVGFKPTELIGFDLARIPRVVTTIDLKSVSKAIEDLFDSEETPETRTEIDVLKKVYQSILMGAENVGFKMQAEKRWFSSILLNSHAVVA